MQKEKSSIHCTQVVCAITVTYEQGLKHQICLNIVRWRVRKVKVAKLVHFFTSLPKLLNFSPHKSFVYKNNAQILCSIFIQIDYTYS